MFRVTCPHSTGLRAAGQEVTRASRSDRAWASVWERAPSFRLALRQHIGNFHSFSLAAGTRLPAYPVLGLRILPHLISPHPRGYGLPNVPTVIMINKEAELPLAVAEQKSPMPPCLPQTCRISDFHFPFPAFDAQMETSLSRITAASGKTARQRPSDVLYSKRHRCLGKCLTGQHLPSQSLKIGNDIKNNFKCNTDDKT